MELAVEFIAGISFLVIGLSCVIHTDDWLAWMNEIAQAGRHKAVAIGSLGFFVSAVIVGFHPVWNGMPALLTLVGVLGMLEGALYLLCPGALKPIVGFFTARKQFMRIICLLWLFVALAILYGWWQQVSVL